MQHLEFCSLSPSYKQEFKLQLSVKIQVPTNMFATLFKLYSDALLGMKGISLIFHMDTIRNRKTKQYILLVCFHLSVLLQTV